MNNVILGTKAMTRGISDDMTADPLFDTWVRACMLRHSKGDWGDLDSEDKQLNDESLNTGERLFSSYDGSAYDPRLKKVYVITEYDRSYTTVLYPEEY